MGSRSLIFHEVTTITDSSRVGRPLSSQDPVEDFASDEEVAAGSPRGWRVEKRRRGLKASRRGKQ